MQQKKARQGDGSLTKEARNKATNVGHPRRQTTTRRQTLLYEPY